MRNRSIARCVLAGLAAAVLLCCQFAGPMRMSATYAVENPPPIPAEEQPEALTQGPVHESFAEPVDTNPEEQGLVTPTAPPANIQETPPGERPEGDHVLWVPGYWAWESERKTHIWVSGCWRVAPPQTSWVPGYWVRIDGGWEWVSGFWARSGAQEIEYVSAPPTIDIVAPAPPSADVVWVPPCWYWHEGRFILRSGYWLRPQAGWVWVPSHYVRTPRGYVFVNGYWDFVLTRRGVLFAPVAISPAVVVRVGFVYRPSVVIDLDILTVHLFAYPRYRHYCFGNYYDAVYVNVGIYPWFECDRRHGWYDPIFEHRRWSEVKRDARWEDRMRRDYDTRRGDVNLRPARTYRETEARIARAPEPQRANLRIAEPLTTVVAKKSGPVKFERITPEAQQTIGKQANEVNKFREDRGRWESERGSKQAIPPSGRGSVTPPGQQRKEDANTPDRPDRRDNAAPPGQQRKDGAPPTPDRKPEPVPAPTPDRKPTEVRPGDRRPAEATPVPSERKDNATPPGQQRKESTPPSAKPDEKPATPPPAKPDDKDKKPAPTPPAQQPPSRDERPGQSERVRVPQSPITDRDSKSDKGDRSPPGRPSDEERQQSPSRGSRGSEASDSTPNRGSDSRDDRSRGQDSDRGAGSKEKDDRGGGK